MSYFGFWFWFAVVELVGLIWLVVLLVRAESDNLGLQDTVTSLSRMLRGEEGKFDHCPDSTTYAYGCRYPGCERTATEYEPSGSNRQTLCSFHYRMELNWLEKVTSRDVSAVREEFERGCG